MPSKKLLLYRLRWMISVVLLLLVTVQLDIDILLTAVRSIPSWFLLFSISSLFLLQLIAAVKWKVLLPGSSLLDLLKLNMIGFFYAFALPSSISGDVSKIVIGRSVSKDGTTFAASVIVDRALGLLALFLLLALVLPFSELRGAFFIRQDWDSVIIAIAVSVIAALSVYAAARSFGLLGRVPGLLKQTFAAIGRFRESPMRLLASFLFSMVFQIATSLSYLIVNLVLDINVSFADYVVCLAVLQVGSLLPLSVAGIGLKEVSFITLLGMLGVPSEKSYTAVLIGYPVTLLYAIAGFVLFTRHRRPAAEHSRH